MFEQDLSATAVRKNNPLFKVALQPADAVWQGDDGLLEQITDFVRNPRDGTNHSMHRVTTAIGGVQFSRAEQFVTYPDGSVQQENVYWDTALQIYYWQSQTDSKWYFEDPCNDDAITKTGSYKKLLRQLEYRQFWWLETDEEVAVTKNPDGSKCYTYKELHDPTQITVLLEEEAEQARIASEKPVSKWKAVALSAMTLWGHSRGFQSLAKSYVSGPDSNQSEPPSVDKPSDTLQSLSANSSAEYKQSAQTESAHCLGQYPFTNVEYQPRVIVNALQFFSVMAIGVASIIHPRPGREQRMLNFPNLLTLLTGVQSADGYMSVEANKKAFSPEATADLADTETFTHVFDIPALADDLRLRIPNPVMYPNQAMQRWSPQWITVLDNSPVASHTSDSAIATSLMPATPLDIPIVYLPEHTQSEQTNSIQETINPLQGQLAQLSLSKHLPVVDAQSRQTLALSSTPSRELNTLSDAIKIATHTAEIERCIREAQEKVIANDEKSAKEKGYTVQVLDNLVLALSKTSELLRKMEILPNYAEEVGLHEATILVDALVEARGYLSTQIADLGLDFFTHLKSTPDVSESFLSGISEKMAEVDSKTLGAIVGGIGAALLLGLAAAAATHMMIKINRNYKRPFGSVEQEEDREDGKDSKKSCVDPNASSPTLSPLEQLKTKNPGVNFETCEDLVVQGDDGVKVYFFSAFYRINDKDEFYLIPEETWSKTEGLHNPIEGLNSNIGKGVVFFGSGPDMQKWPLTQLEADQHEIDSFSLTKVIKKIDSDRKQFKKKTPLNTVWNYERNAAYWCGGMAAGKVFKNFEAFPKNKGDIRRLRERLQASIQDNSGGAVEGDELLWLNDNRYTVGFDPVLNKGGQTLQLSPPLITSSSLTSPPACISLSNLYIGYYNFHKEKQKHLYYNTQDKKTMVAKTRNGRINEIIGTITKS